ncbi:bifunctional dihydrofolate reductase-thymidylate synthase [Caudoviricetes sp.]|nr:bifunctional dihydrofolate reductase-thymidylate synthase [Caudoviricetes sp.]
MKKSKELSRRASTKRAITIKTIMCITPDGRYVNPDGSEIHDRALAVQAFDRLMFMRESLPTEPGAEGVVICGSGTWCKLAMAAYKRRALGATERWFRPWYGANRTLRKLTAVSMLRGVLSGRLVAPVGRMHRLTSVRSAVERAIRMLARTGGVITIAGGAGVWKEWFELWLGTANVGSVWLDTVSAAWGARVQCEVVISVVGSGELLRSSKRLECDGWSVDGQQLGIYDAGDGSLALRRGVEECGRVWNEALTAVRVPQLDCGWGADGKSGLVAAMDGTVDVSVYNVITGAKVGSVPATSGLGLGERLTVYKISGARVYGDVSWVRTNLSEVNVKM